MPNDSRHVPNTRWLRAAAALLAALLGATYSRCSGAGDTDESAAAAAPAMACERVQPLDTRSAAGPACATTGTPSAAEPGATPPATLVSQAQAPVPR